MVAGPYQEVRLRVVVDDQAEAKIIFINELPDYLRHLFQLATSDQLINRKLREKARNYVKIWHLLRLMKKLS